MLEAVRLGQVRLSLPEAPRLAVGVRARVPAPKCWEAEGFRGSLGAHLPGRAVV